ncbi:hypothetical protein [Bacillus solimangrovi]|uniref:Uncharacterized protein n=1 Tax=Bacillus solimangrovi TaxID=1305675 RepID=A0A1E5LDA8_9BACI|nr:hypothetical protein [Bacillus solimangrovi]OEH92061.1 hypothetical protein BFG57_16950 [Bacillus solimangrovi]
MFVIYTFLVTLYGTRFDTSTIDKYDFDQEQELLFTIHKKMEENHFQLNSISISHREPWIIGLELTDQQIEPKAEANMKEIIYKILRSEEMKSIEIIKQFKVIIFENRND